jgi:hypothetical protein
MNEELSTRLISIDGGSAVLELKIGTRKFFLPASTTERDVRKMEIKGDVDMGGHAIKNAREVSARELRSGSNSIGVGAATISYDLRTNRLSCLDALGKRWYIGTLNALEDDDAPRLSADLDCNSKDINNAGNVSCESIALGTNPSLAYCGMSTPLIPGLYACNIMGATTFAPASYATGHLRLFPFSTAFGFKANRIGVNVHAGVALATCKLSIYSSLSNGWPNKLIIESGALDCSAAGVKEATIDVSFSPSRMYWLGLRTSATIQFKRPQTYNTPGLGLLNTSATAQVVRLRYTSTYANPAPGEITFGYSDIENSNAGLVFYLRCSA